MLLRILIANCVLACDSESISGPDLPPLKYIVNRPFTKEALTMKSSSGFTPVLFERKKGTQVLSLLKRLED